MVVYNTGGGFSGRGDGRVVITSQGDVAAGRPSIPEIRFECSSHLSTSDLRMMEQLIASSNPDRWNARYVSPESRYTDELGFGLELHRRVDNGSEQIYVTSWDTSSFGLLPADLMAIDEAVARIKANVLARCD